MTWIFVLLLASLPLGHLTRIEFTPQVAFYPHDLAAAAVLAVVVWQAIKKKRLPQTPLTKPILVFSAIAAVSLFINFSKVQPREFLIGSLYFIRWLSFAAIYFYLATSKNFKLKLLGKSYPLIDSLALAGVTLAIFGLIQYFIFPDVTVLKWLRWDDHYFRLVGPTLDPGFTGMFLVLTLMILPGVDIKKPARLGLAALVLTALLLTYSRASYLAFAGGLVTFLWLKKRLKLGIAALAVFISLLFFLPKPGGPGVDLTRLFSVEARVQSWQRALEASRTSPIIGVGFNLLRYSYQRLNLWGGEDVAISHSASGVENSYLFVLATTGVVGLVSYLWLLKQAFSLSLKLKQPSLTASLIAISLHALFTNTWFYPWVMLWVWILLSQKFKGSK